MPPCFLGAESPSYPSVVNTAGVRYALRPQLDFINGGVTGWALSIRGSDVSLLFYARPGYRSALDHIATSFRWGRRDSDAGADAASDAGKAP